MIATLDTNVLISAVLFGGNPGAILKAAIEGAYTLALSPAIVDELEGVLLRPKFGLGSETVHVLIREIEDLALVCYPSKSHRIIDDDPADDAVVDCAVEAKANYVVSGDRHLLSRDFVEGIPVASVPVFLGILTTHRR